MVRVTIKDIAQDLGVSANTVSRALRNMPDISEETKRRVRQKADEMKYTKNFLASTLRTQTSHTVGIIIPDISNPIYSNIYKGIESVCKARDYGVFLSNTNESVLEERNVIERMISHQADGLILCPCMENNYNIRLLNKESIPFVLVGRTFQDENVYSVLTDDFQGGYLVCEHLILRGYDSFIYLSGPLYISSAIERQKGFEKCMSDHGMNPTELLTIETEPTWIGAYNAVEKLLAAGIRKRAIFAFNDMMAMGVLKLLQKHGISVPNQIAVIGYDNIDLSDSVVPSLTTIDINQHLLGEKSMTMLLDILENKQPEQSKFYFSPRIIVRKST